MKSKPKKKLSPIEAYGFPPRGKDMKADDPKSIKESIADLQDFLECDLYSKFRPEHKIPSGKKGKMETWYRKDMFKNEKDFTEYLDAHFKILEDEIVRIIGKQKYRKRNEK